MRFRFIVSRSPGNSFTPEPCLSRGNGCQSRRPAYTLLELVLALGIGVVLLAALYLAMSTTLFQQRLGRGVIEQSAEMRNLLSKMETDITSQLAPIAPQMNNQAVQLTTGTGAPASSLTPNTTGPVVFNLQVQGDSTHLSVYSSLLPREVYQNPPPSDGLPLTSDLRRVDYWLAGGTDSPLGLARQELLVATAAEALTVFDPSQVDEKSMVIADQILGVEFQYFDGSEWQDSWDGTAVQSDGKTPMGPPPAIAITLTVRQANATSDEATVTYRHVVAIPTANNFVTAPAVNPNSAAAQGSTTP
jgi:type II secretory pathway component PulJ